MRVSPELDCRLCGRRGLVGGVVASGRLGFTRVYGRRVLARALVALVLVLVAIPAGARADGLGWGAPVLVDAGAPYEHSLFDLEAVSCPSAGLCVAIDPDAFVAWPNPGRGQPAWKSVSGPATACPSGASGRSCPLFLSGVSCASASLCAAASGNEAYCGSSPCGGLLTSTDPLDGDWDGGASSPINPLTAVSCTPTGMCVAVGDAGYISTVSPGSSPPGATNLSAVSCASSSLCVAIDDAGDVLSSTNPAGGASWASEKVDPGHRLTGISCPSASLCAAVDDAGRVLVSTNPGAPAAAWTPAPVDGVHSLLGIMCPSGSLCAAVDDAGDVVTSSNPTGGASTWTVAALGARSLTGVSCASASLCVVVSSVGDVFTSTEPSGGPAAWARSGIGQYNRLETITCPRVSFCVAGDDGGNLLSTHAPRNGASSWSADAVDAGHTVTRVLCPTASICLATDNVGAVFTTSSGSRGAAKWVATPFDPRPGGALDLTCTAGKPAGRPAQRRATACFAFDRARRVFLTKYRGGRASAWKRAGSTPRRVHDMSCPATNRCFGLDPRNQLIESKHPSGGARAWKRTQAPFSGSPPTSVAGDQWIGPVRLTCPSASLCLATDVAASNWSDVRVSTDPASRHPRWKTVETTNSELTSPSCSSPSLCWAVGQSGDVAVSTDPTRRRSWHDTRIDHGNALTAVSCPSPSLCLATDDVGNVIQGSRVGVGHHLRPRNGDT
jgi:hypothetical protein